VSDKAFPFEQVVVIGGTGQTGHRVLEGLLERKVSRIVATSRACSPDGLPTGPLAGTITADAKAWGGQVRWYPLDLEATPNDLAHQLDAMAEALKAGAPTALVFAAAFTNVDGCETDPERCKRVNETNTVAVLDWGRSRFGAKLVFYSTDYVFDGVTGPYDEYAGRHAISRYGSSKVFVEEWLEAHAPDALILRTTGVYDYLPGSKNFVMNMLDLWAKGTLTRIPEDQYANPVWAADLARATLEVLEKRSAGIFNVAGARQLGRVEFARLIAKIFDKDASLIFPVKTADLAQKARRPLRGGLRCDKLKRELGWAPGDPERILLKLWKERAK
jgi:dTDP-4-dehydrorhamnose reductase